MPKRIPRVLLYWFVVRISATLSPLMSLHLTNIGFPHIVNLRSRVRSPFSPNRMLTSWSIELTTISGSSLTLHQDAEKGYSLTPRENIHIITISIHYNHIEFQISVDVFKYEMSVCRANRKAFSTIKTTLFITYEC